jgi:hypothetical protein
MTKSERSPPVKGERSERQHEQQQDGFAHSANKDPSQDSLSEQPPRRPIFVVKFRPEPGVDGVRSLRALLKIALRQHGLRCVGVRGLP